jgi:predicted DNA-binding protein
MEDMITKPAYTGFYVRLRPKAKELLDKATEAQGRSRMAILHELIHQHLEPRRSLEDRLDRMIRGGE